MKAKHSTEVQRIVTTLFLKTCGWSSVSPSYARKHVENVVHLCQSFSCTCADGCESVGQHGVQKLACSSGCGKCFATLWTTAHCKTRQIKVVWLCECTHADNAAGFNWVAELEWAVEIAVVHGTAAEIDAAAMFTKRRPGVTCSSLCLSAV